MVLTAWQTWGFGTSVIVKAMVAVTISTEIDTVILVVLSGVVLKKKKKLCCAYRGLDGA